MTLFALIAALAKEACTVVRAAIDDWLLTARLLLIIIVVAATICVTGWVLR